jgi:hypothetical protein
MANAGDGADWLQATERAVNPYFGARMPNCSAVPDVLVAGPSAGLGPGADGTDHHDH